MKIIRDYIYVDPENRGASVAVGNFDGVHLGHQSVIDLARQTAETISAPLGILTFEPHPRSYFAPQSPAFRLMSSEARATRLAKLDVDLLYELNFNTSLSSLTPREFAQNVIADGLGLSHLVVGADFCFGKGRAGTVEDLQHFGAEMGFGVTVAPLIEAGEGQVSSTSIRSALAEGRPRDAATQLGHWHRIEGIVIGGEQRGRELGYEKWGLLGSKREMGPRSKPVCQPGDHTLRPAIYRICQAILPFWAFTEHRPKPGLMGPEQ